VAKGELVKSRKIMSTAIFFMIAFWFSELLGAEYFPKELDMPAREKTILVGIYSNLLASMKESPLFPLAIDPNKVTYRFIYLSARGGKSVVLRLDRVNKTKWVLIVKQRDGFSPKEGLIINRKKCLAEAEVNQFQKLLAQLQFWQLPTVGALEAEEVLDGIRWILEGVENGRYHLVRRISPKSGIWDSVPDDTERFEKLRQEQGYPYIDRATNDEVNRRLVEVGEFLVKLSGLELKIERK
jgi:hypothetical protein